MNTRLQSVTIFRHDISNNDLYGHANFETGAGEVKFKLSEKALERISIIVTADILGTMNELIDAVAVESTNGQKAGERSEQNTQFAGPIN